MSGCTECGGAFVPHTDLCLGCGPLKVSTPRRRWLAQVALTDSTAHDRLHSVLVAVTGESDGAIALVLTLQRFGLSFDATDEQKSRLQSMVSGTGAMCRLTDQAAPDDSHSYRWTGARPLPEKLTFTAVLGITALALGVPLVPIAALVTVGVMTARAIKRVPQRLSIANDVTDHKLSLLDNSTFLEAHRVIHELQDPILRESARCCVNHVAEILWIVRADGAHLCNLEHGRLDDQIYRVLRQSLRLAASAGRVAQPTKATHVQRDLTRIQLELVQRLADAEASLDRLRVCVREMLAVQAQSQVLVGARKELMELQGIRSQG